MISDVFSPDEGMAAPPEGDIAALAAKVQRSSGGAGGKKKASKKSQELQESLVRDGSFAPPPQLPLSSLSVSLCVVTNSTLG